jgi:hypothetical protein
MLSLQKNQRTRGQNKFCPKAGEGGREGKGEVAQTMYTHVSKCKNYKVKLKRQYMFTKICFC